MINTAVVSVVFKLLESRGRYRELVGEVISAHEPSQRTAIRTMLGKACHPVENDVELRGRLYRTTVHVLNEQPEYCYVEADSDGVPIDAQDIKAKWADPEARAYVGRLAERWSRAEGLTPESQLPIASEFIPPLFRLTSIGIPRTSEGPSQVLPWQALSDHSRVVLLGEPGAGKTSCLRRLLSETSQQSRRHSDTLPVYLQLREFPADRLNAQGIRRLLATESGVDLDSDFSSAVAGGRILLLLDGLDEIAAQRERDLLLTNLRTLCREIPNIRVVLTSREHSYKGELPDFTHLQLQPFSTEQISHWVFQHVPADNGGRLYRSLIHALERDPHLRDLLTNPLMLALAVNAGVGGYGASSDRAMLLRLCLEAITEYWDTTRGISRWAELGTTPRQVRNSLAGLSRTLLLQDREEFTERDVQEIIESTVGISDSPGPLLFACHASGLVTSRDRRTYRFTHQAMSEYLAADRVVDHVSDVEPLLRGFTRGSSAERVWALSCASATDASDLLRAALRLEGSGNLERATILASALSQQISASRALIGECSDFIAEILEDELSDAQISFKENAEEFSAAEPSSGVARNVLGKIELAIPTAGDDSELDQTLEHLLVALYWTRSGSCYDVVRTRLLRSEILGVQLLAALLTMEGEYAARVVSGKAKCEISIAVTKPSDDTFSGFGDPMKPSTGRTVKSAMPTGSELGQEIQLGTEGEEAQELLHDLSEWLQGEPSLRGRVALATSLSPRGDLGSSSEALTVKVGGTEAVSALSASLRAFMTQPRRRNERITIRGPEGRAITILSALSADIQALLVGLLR